MSKDAPGIIMVGDAREVQRLWDSGVRDINSIVEATELTQYEVLVVLAKANKLTLDAFYIFDPVEKITGIHVAHIWEDDHLPCISFFFKDEKNRLRYAEILYDEYGPGVVRYAPCCREAYNDLLEIVNDYYRMRKEEEEENV